MTNFTKLSILSRRYQSNTDICLGIDAVNVDRRICSHYGLTDLTVLSTEVRFAPADVGADAVLAVAAVQAGRRLALVAICMQTHTGCRVVILSNVH